MNPFEYAKPDNEQIAVIMKTRDLFKELYEFILKVVPESAERTLAVRDLERSNMWVNKAVAFRGEKYRT